MIGIALFSIVSSVAGAVAGRWIVRRFLGLSDEPSGRQLAHDVLAATADKRVTAAERDRLRADAKAILEGIDRSMRAALDRSLGKAQPPKATPDDNRARLEQYFVERFDRDLEEMRRRPS